MTTNVKKKVIVEVGVEGGSIALLGVRDDEGWRYSLYFNDWTPELLDEEPIQRQSDQVATWDAAIALLDRYPWRQFSPIRVHPEFRGKVWTAVCKEIGDSTDYPHRLEDWKAICKGAGDEVPTR
jgi:hypothetical protein